MSTSKLQIAVGNMLYKTFPHMNIRENHRPDWLLSENLTRLELDYYIEDIKTAFEIQGDQHYKYVPYFHKDHDDYLKRLSYDKTKKDLCYGAGVNLIEICTLLDAIVAINELDRKYNIITEPGVVIYIAQPIPDSNPCRWGCEYIHSNHQLNIYAKNALRNLSKLEDNEIRELHVYFSRLSKFCENNQGLKKRAFFFDFYYLDEDMQGILKDELMQFGFELIPIKIRNSVKYP